MLKKFLAISALAAGATVLAATPASADGQYDYDNYYTSEVTEHYVSVLDPAAYGARSGDSLIVSPFGASQPIYCFSYRGHSNCWQVDPSGIEHDLPYLTFPTGSSAGATRSIFFYDPF